MAIDDPSQLAIVARFNRLHEAQLARAQLEDAGIACMLVNPGMTGMTSIFDAEHSGVKLKVAADDADEARAVLDATSDNGPGASRN